jgi:hypothetical protein
MGKQVKKLGSQGSGGEAFVFHSAHASGLLLVSRATYFLMIDLNNILLCIPTSHKWPLPFKFSN